MSKNKKSKAAPVATIGADVTPVTQVETAPPLTNGCLVKYEDCINETYRKWSGLMGCPPNPSRKQWEDVYIAQALFERGMLTEGKRGIGFGVGQERMVSLFASFGCKILATDQVVTADSERRWGITGQLGKTLDDLYFPEICDLERFAANVEFENCDMNAIPEKYHGQFDFAYSACSLDHLGSLAKSMTFIENSLKCLKPGGWAVHTTEFNLGALNPAFDGKTTEEGATVFFRKSDIEFLANDLRSKGYVVADIDFSRGEHPENWNVDMEPHSRPSSHLVLQVCTGSESGYKGWVATSILFVAQRPL